MQRTYVAVLTFLTGCGGAVTSTTGEVTAACVGSDEREPNSDINAPVFTGNYWIIEQRALHFCFSDKDDVDVIELTNTALLQQRGYWTVQTSPPQRMEVVVTNGSKQVTRSLEQPILLRVGTTSEEVLHRAFFGSDGAGTAVLRVRPATPDSRQYTVTATWTPVEAAGGSLEDSTPLGHGLALEKDFSLLPVDDEQTEAWFRFYSGLHGGNASASVTVPLPLAGAVRVMLVDSDGKALASAFATNGEGTVMSPEPLLPNRDYYVRVVVDHSQVISGVGELPEYYTKLAHIRLNIPKD